MPNEKVIILAHQVYHWILTNSNLFSNPKPKKDSIFVNISDFYESMTESLLADIFSLTELINEKSSWKDSYFKILEHIIQLLPNAIKSISASKSNSIENYKKLLTVCLKYFANKELEIKPRFKDLFLEMLTFNCVYFIKDEENFKLITFMIMRILDNKELIIADDYVKIIKFIIGTCYECYDPLEPKKILETLHHLLGLLIKNFPFQLLLPQKKEEKQNHENNSSTHISEIEYISLGQWFLNSIITFKNKEKEQFKLKKIEQEQFNLYYVILKRYFQIFKDNNIKDVNLDKPFDILNDFLYSALTVEKEKEKTQKKEEERSLTLAFCRKFFEDKKDYYISFYYNACISKAHLTEVKYLYKLFDTHPNPFLFNLFQLILKEKPHLFPDIFNNVMTEISKINVKGNYNFNSNLVRIILLLYNNQNLINSIKNEDFCTLLEIIKKAEIHKSLVVFPTKENPNIKKTILEIIFDLIILREDELPQDIFNIFYSSKEKAVDSSKEKHVDSSKEKPVPIEMDEKWDSFQDSLKQYFQLDVLKSITNDTESTTKDIRFISKFNISVLLLAKTFLVEKANNTSIEKLKTNLFNGVRKLLKKSNEEPDKGSLFIKIKNSIIKKGEIKENTKALEAFSNDITKLISDNELRKDVSSSNFQTSIFKEKPVSVPALILSNFNPPKPEKTEELIFEDENKKTNCEQFSISNIEINKDKDLRFYKYLKSIVFQKKEFLLGSFSLIFKNYYFDNLNFIKIKNLYHSIFQDNEITKVINFPSKIKNFTNGLEPPQFLKQNMKFFDEPYFSITHQYVVEHFKSIPKQPKINFFRSIAEGESQNTDNSNETIDCEVISIQNIYRGSLSFYDDLFCFVSNKEKSKENDLIYLFGSFEKELTYNPNKKIFICYRNIREIVLKRFLYRYQAYEIYLNNGKSYFLNFFSEENGEKFINKVSSYIPKEIIILDCVKHFEVNKYTQKWKDKEISTYDYLLLLNKYSSRSFNDGNQYFVFPWVVLDFTEFLNLKSNAPEKKKYKIKWRDFATPPSAQSKEMIEKAKEKFTMCSMEGKKKTFKFHFNTHYSTSSFVYYFLARMTPFLEDFVKLQNNRLENPDRMFHSIIEAITFMSKYMDNRELVPEFFSQIEFLLNLNCAYLGRKSNKVLIDDFNIDELKEIDKLGKDPPKLSDYVLFISRNRYLLKTRERNIHQWINYIFGDTQFHQNKDIVTLFKKTTYEKGVSWAKIENKYIGTSKEEYLQKVYEKKNLILNFGQCPMQILGKSSSMLSDQEIILSNIGDDFVHFGMNKEAKQYERQFESPSLYFISNIPQKICVFLLKSRTISLTTKILKKKFLTAKEKTINIEFDCPKFRLFKDKAEKRYKLSPKYTMIFLEKLEAIITGRYTSNIFIINYTAEKEKEKFKFEETVLCEDFIYSLARIDGSQFLTGMKNGKLTQWIIEETKIDEGQKKRILKAKQVKFVYAHEKAITVIEVNNRLNVIVTGGEDYFIYIRGLISFELLTVIKIRNYCIPKQIIIKKNNLLYCLCYLTKKLKTKKKTSNDNDNTNHQCENISTPGEDVPTNENKNANSIIIGFTLSGVKFAQSEPEDISCIDMKNQEFIKAIIYNQNKIIGYSSHSLKVVKSSSNEKGEKENKNKNNKNNNNNNNKCTNEQNPRTWIQNPVLNSDNFSFYSTTKDFHVSIEQ